MRNRKQIEQDPQPTALNMHWARKAVQQWEYEDTSSNERLVVIIAEVFDERDALLTLPRGEENQ